MDNLDITIRKLLKNSLFLGVSKRNKLESLLPRITIIKKEGLLKILQSEEEVLKKEIMGFLAHGGEEDELNRIFSYQKGLVSNELEKEDRAREDKKMEKIMSEID